MLIPKSGCCQSLLLFVSVLFIAHILLSPYCCTPSIVYKRTIVTLYIFHQGSLFSSVICRMQGWLLYWKQDWAGLELGCSFCKTQFSSGLSLSLGCGSSWLWVLCLFSPGHFAIQSFSLGISYCSYIPLQNLTNVLRWRPIVCFILLFFFFFSDRTLSSKRCETVRDFIMPFWPSPPTFNISQPMISDESQPILYSDAFCF